jgi:hypothetical protein
MSLSKKFKIAEQIMVKDERMTFRDVEFDSYKDFEKYYLNNPDPSCYEIIIGQQCLYFDFDSKEKIPENDFK